MKLQKSKNATRNIIYGMLLKIYQMFMPFVMRTVIIYYLGAEFLGLSSLFNSILQVLNLAELGVGSAMVFSMYKPIAENDKEKLCALLNLYRKYYRIIGTLILIIGVAIVPVLPKLISGSLPAGVDLYILYFLNLSATVLTYWLFAFKNSLLQAYQRTDVVSKVFIVTDTLKYILQIVSLIIFKDYYLYCIVLLVSQIMNNIMIAYGAKQRYPDLEPKGHLPKAEQKIINGKIKDLFTTKLATTLLSSGDTLVISAMLGLIMLAMYQNYYYLISAVLGCFTIIHTAITAGIGNSLIVDTMEKVKQTFNMLFFGILWLLTFCVGCFLSLMQPFMEMWVGNKLMLKDEIVILLVIYFCVYELTQFFSVYKEAAGIWHQDRFRPLICSIINIVLNLIFVQKWGVYGVVLATIISSGCVSLPWVIHNVFKYILKENPAAYLQKFLKYVLFGILINILIGIITAKIHLSIIMDLGIKLIICISVINIVWILFFRKTEEFIELKNMITRVLQGRKKHE